MLNIEDIDEIQIATITWLNNTVLSIDFALQISLIFIAAGCSILVYRSAKPKLQERINSLKVHYRVAEALRNLTKLIVPFIAMLVLGIGAAILNAFGNETALVNGVTKLLLAWIGIKIVIQFIENKFARQMAGWVIWGIAALSIFGILDDASMALDALGISFGEFRISALTVIKGILALFALLYIANIIANISERQVSKIDSLSPSSRVLINKISRVFFIVAALLIGITSAGIDLSLLAVFSGAVGLGIGFGLQKGVSNLFAGMMLLIDESIKPGDIIELPATDGTDTFGWVNHMGARYTEIVTRDNKSFLVPNEDFITQKVVNWSHGDTLVRVQTSFGVHYESDPHEVIRLAVEAAGRADRVVDSPSPVCWLVEFGDSSLNFSLRYWIKDAEKGVTNTKGAVMISLWDIFKEHGIQIPYPHREVFIHEVPKVIQKSEKKKA